MTGKKHSDIFDDAELDEIFERDDVENNIRRTDFNEEELAANGGTKKKKVRRRHNNRRKNFGRLLLIIVLALALIGAAVFFISNIVGSRHQTSFKEYDTTLKTVSNGKIDMYFYLAEVESDFTDFDEDPDYVYIKLYYRVINTTSHDLSWKDMPYVSICRYDYDGTAYNLVEGSEQEFDLGALRSYGLSIGLDFSDIKEDLAPDIVPPRYGADIIKIPKSEWDIGSYFVTIDNINAIIKINEPNTNRRIELLLEATAE